MLGTVKSVCYDIDYHGRRVKPLDTPGFDDSGRNDFELLLDIVNLL